MQQGNNHGDDSELGKSQQVVNIVFNGLGNRLTEEVCRDIIIFKGKLQLVFETFKKQSVARFLYFHEVVAQFAIEQILYLSDSHVKYLLDRLINQHTEKKRDQLYSCVLYWILIGGTIAEEDHRVKKIGYNKDSLVTRKILLFVDFYRIKAEYLEKIDQLSLKIEGYGSNELNIDVTNNFSKINPEKASLFSTLEKEKADLERNLEYKERRFNFQLRIIQISDELKGIKAILDDGEESGRVKQLYTFLNNEKEILDNLDSKIEFLIKSDNFDLHRIEIKKLEAELETINKEKKLLELDKISKMYEVLIQEARDQSLIPHKKTAEKKEAEMIELRSMRQKIVDIDIEMKEIKEELNNYNL